ncbi:MAG: hypothetical protein HYY84_00150 [Deltaproteobacteria bacterium]|nr:hypothetical protein [Deltaproteobacteria bacterium]
MTEGIIIVIPGESNGDDARAGASGEDAGAGVEAGAKATAAFDLLAWSVSAAHAASLNIFAGGLGGSATDFDFFFSVGADGGAGAETEAWGFAGAPDAAVNEKPVTHKKTAAKPASSQRSREIPNTSSDIG